MNASTAPERGALAPAAATGLALLRAPVPEHLISPLPKGTKAQNECDPSQKINCRICGGWHHPQIRHLDYVGHAAATHLLLDADPTWTWEPLAFTDRGLPAFDESGGLWIKLTVCSVTRLGYGHADKKQHMDAGSREKEVIGDAIRNAAMRFGLALDLWSKADLHAGDDGDNSDDVTRDEPVHASAPASKPDSYPDAKFKTNFPTWQALIFAGTKTADQIIAMVETKSPLTAKQKAEIRKSPRPDEQPGAKL
jgi:hypothetical protein